MNLSATRQPSEKVCGALVRLTSKKVNDYNWETDRGLDGKFECKANRSGYVFSDYSACSAGHTDYVAKSGLSEGGGCYHANQGWGLNGNLFVPQYTPGLQCLNANLGHCWRRTYGRGKAFTPAVATDGSLIFCTGVGKKLVRVGRFGKKLWSRRAGNCRRNPPAFNSTPPRVASNHSITTPGGATFETTSVATAPRPPRLV